MVRVRPFKAVHPTFENAPAIAALPYDVQSIDEARRIVEANPRSFLAIDEPVVNFPEGTDPYDLHTYLKAGELLAQAKADGSMVQDDQPRFYLYELTMDGRVQNGLVACVSVDDYLDGTVKEHESTRIDKEVDRINHVRGCQAQTGPIFLAHHATPELSQVHERAKEEEPLFDLIADDGVRHRGFAIPEECNGLIQDLCQDLGRVYIADGHHRIAAAAEVAKAQRAFRGSSDGAEESSWIMAVLFPDEELAILPYDRVVLDLNGHSVDGFLSELQDRFDAQVITDDGGEPLTVMDASDPHEAASRIRPTTKGEFAAYLDGRWYRCTMDPASIPADPYGRLDAALMQDRLLEPLLGVRDPRRSPRLDFVGGIRGLGELERRCASDCVAAFALPATTIDELFAVADADLLMPPKSTWFEPKLRSGLFIHGI